MKTKYLYGSATAGALALTLGLFTNMYGFNSGTVNPRQIGARMDSKYMGASSRSCVFTSFPLAFTETTIVLRFKIQDSPVKFRNYVAQELGCRIASLVTREGDPTDISFVQLNPYFPVVTDASCTPALYPIGTTEKSKTVAIVCDRRDARLINVLARHEGQKAFFKITNAWRELIDDSDDGFVSGP